MALTINNLIQAPTTPFDMAYGANTITLDGILPTQGKYALQKHYQSQTLDNRLTGLTELSLIFRISYRLRYNLLLITSMAYTTLVHSQHRILECR